MNYEEKMSWKEMFLEILEKNHTLKVSFKMLNTFLKVAAKS